MATATGGVAALAAALVPHPTDTAATTATTTSETPSTMKSVEELLKEIEALKTEVESATKDLEKIDTSKKKAAGNRDRSIEGRTKVKDLNDRVTTLLKQMEAMTKDTDPVYPSKKFDKTKKTALKTLSGLSKDLTQVDKHLEKAVGAVPTTATATSADLASTGATEAAAATTDPKASTEKEKKKSSSFRSKLPFGGGKKKSKKSTDGQTPKDEAASAKPADGVADTAQKKDTAAASDDEDEEEEEEEDEEEEEEEDVSKYSDDDDVVSDKKKGPEKPLVPARKPEPIISSQRKNQVSSSDSSASDFSEDQDDAIVDNRNLLNALESTKLDPENTTDSRAAGRRSPASTKPQVTKKAPAIKTEPAPSPSPRIKKSTSKSPSPTPPHKKSSSPRARVEVPKGKKKVDHSDEDSYFEEEDEHGDYEEEEEGEEEELQRLREHDERDDAASERDYEEPEEGEPTLANAHVQELRANKYAPGTQFLVTYPLTGTQTGDLTVRKGDILTLIEQRSDDWWLFKNKQTEQEGVVPINHIQLLSSQQPRRRVKPSTSATTIVDAFKTNNIIPAGFIASDLAPLTQLEEYNLWRAMVPRMTESNLSFSDLHWRADTDKLHIQEVTHQKILVLKECVKIPRIKGEQVRVLNRCVRVCIYDGFEIISNIHTVRGFVPSKIDQQAHTEDWHFASDNTNTLIDEQPQLLIRSNRFVPGQNLNLLIELSQYCQSTVTQEKCEIGCGWSMVSLDDDKPPLISDTKNYNELLNGGHTTETKVLLDPQYKVLHSDGISGMIDRFKRARVKFSIESRENDVDVLYDNLPIQSIVVPINLVRSLVFFRNELAYQINKRRHPTGLSTTPIDSIFLSTFFQALAQPDLMYTIHRLYRSLRSRFLNSSSSTQQQRELYIKTYESFIYPLLQFRLLPTYDFHDTLTLNERRNIINDMVKRQSSTKKRPADDILSIFLDPNYTEKWTPFTTNEISFSLQKYIQDFSSDIVP